MGSGTVLLTQGWNPAPALGAQSSATDHQGVLLLAYTPIIRGNVPAPALSTYRFPRFGSGSYISSLTPTHSSLHSHIASLQSLCVLRPVVLCDFAHAVSVAQVPFPSPTLDIMNSLEPQNLPEVGGPPAESQIPGQSCPHAVLSSVTA